MRTQIDLRIFVFSARLPGIRIRLQLQRIVSKFWIKLRLKFELRPYRHVQMLRAVRIVTKEANTLHVTKRTPGFNNALQERRIRISVLGC